MKSGQILQFPFTRGLAEDDNEKDKPVATLKSAVNVRWPKAGVIGKRFGSDVLPPVAGKRFITRDQELAISDGNFIRSYDADSNSWVIGPRITDVSLSWKTHVDSIRGAIAADTAVLDDGAIVDAWVAGDPLVFGTQSLYYQVRSAAGTIVLPPTRITDSALRHIRLITSGALWLVIYSEAGGVYAFSPGAGSTLLETGAVTSSTTFSMDAVVAGTDFIVAFNRAGGGIALERYTFATTPVAVSDDVVTGETSTTIQSISLALGTSLFITYSSLTANEIRYACANPTTLAQTLAPTAAAVGVAISVPTVAATMMSATTCLLLWSFVDSPILPGIMRVVTLTAAGVVTDGQATLFLRPLSKPFAVGSRFYAFACTDTLGLGLSGPAIPGNDTFLVDVTHAVSDEPFRLVGKVDVNIGGIWTRGFVTAPDAETATIIHAALPYQAVPSPYSSGWRQGLRSIRIASGDDAQPDMWRSVEIQREAIIAGALVTAYDSVDAIGYGWPHAPQFVVSNTAAANGGAMSDGTYQYNVTAERVSAVGVMHRAPFGQATEVVVTQGPTGKVGIELTGVALGRSARNPGHYPIYRTLANGSTLHRLTIEPSYMVLLEDLQGGTSPVHSDEDEDGSIGPYEDIELETRPLPYIDGDELEDFQPPAAYSLNVHKNRLGIITGGRREYWYSKDMSENPGIAPGFHPTQVELYDCDLVASVTLDDKRLMMAEDRIMVVFGDGPTVSGGDNRFSQPQRIQTDVGCTNPRSVVSWPGGVIFQNGTDLHSISRELAVAWIGRDVRDITAAYPRITSAVLVSDESEIRFTCNNTGNSAGLVLVYDYARNAWSTRTYPSYDDPSLGGSAILDAVIHQGVYYLMTPEEVRYEDVSTHLDTVQDGTGSTVQYAPSVVELNSLQPAGSVGWQRVRIVKPVGASLSNHSLTISVSRDFATTYEQVESWAAGTDVTNPGPYERAEVALTVQRRQSVGVKITDAAPANTTTHPLGNGAGFQIEGIALLVQPKTGLPRDTPARRGG